METCPLCGTPKEIHRLFGKAEEPDPIWPPWRDPNYVLYGEDGTPIEYT